MTFSEIAQRGKVLTPQEHYMLGSTPDERAEDLYKSVGIQAGELSVEEAKKLREEMKYVKSLLGFTLGLERQIAVSLESLDDSGRTTSDPKVLGTVNPETNEVEEMPGRDLTQELRKKIEGSGINMGLRGEGGRESENTRI